MTKLSFNRQKVSMVKRYFNAFVRGNVIRNQRHAKKITKFQGKFDNSEPSLDKFDSFCFVLGGGRAAKEG